MTELEIKKCFQKPGKAFFSLLDEADNWYSLWDEELGKKAEGFIGAKVKVQIREKGDFKNITAINFGENTPSAVKASPYKGATVGGDDRQKSIEAQNALTNAQTYVTSYLNSVSPSGWDYKEGLSLISETVEYFLGVVQDAKEPKKEKSSIYDDSLDVDTPEGSPF